jgi:RNA-directed DNA polymerase
VRHLPTRLLRRDAQVLGAVRRITQVNRGQQTPGLDGARVPTPDERARLADALPQDQPWIAAPVRRGYLPKANGQQRPLGMPTRRDRVRQRVVKNALASRCEAEFEAPRDGVRPGHCGQDALAEVDVARNTSAAGHHHDILDAEIQGAVDHISQDVILRRMGPRPGRELIHQGQKAG